MAQTEHTLQLFIYNYFTKHWDEKKTKKHISKFLIRIFQLLQGVRLDLELVSVQCDALWSVLRILQLKKYEYRFFQGLQLMNQYSYLKV